MPSDVFKRVDKRYLVSALADNTTHATMTQFQSGLSYEGVGVNKVERAAGIINYIFDERNTDELVIELLDFLFVENPYAQLSSSNPTFHTLKAKVLDPRGVVLTDDGFRLPDQATDAPERLHGLSETRGDTDGSLGLPWNLAGDPAIGAIGNRPQIPPAPNPLSVTPFGKRKAFEMPPKDVVFVVHGRDMRPVQVLDDFLGFLGLKVMSWSDAVRLTGEAQPHTYDIVKAGMDGAAAVIVVFSPDDEACTKAQFRANGESADPMGQARQNVLVEAGMAFATSRDRTIFVQSESTRPVTDLEGFNWVKLDGAWDSRADLINRLESAGADPRPRYKDLAHRTAGLFKIEED